MTLLAFYRDGTLLQELPIKPGQTVMEVATRNAIPGIIAECGGAMACATCHVHVSADDQASFEEQDESELDMLDGASHFLADQSRLSCQLVLRDLAERISIIVPESQ